MRKERVGFAVCGSFCTHEAVLRALEKVTASYETVIPIASENAAFTDTRFGTADDLLERLEELTGHAVLCNIPSVEPIGPKKLLDILKTEIPDAKINVCCGISSMIYFVFD